MKYRIKIVLNMGKEEPVRSGYGKGLSKNKSTKNAWNRCQQGGYREHERRGCVWMFAN